MPSKFNTYFGELAFPVLKREFAENLVYVFVRSGNRAMTGIVNRNPPAFYDAAGNVVLPAYTVRLASNATTGVLSSEVNTGGDEIVFVDDVCESGDGRKTVIMKVREGTGVIELAVM